MKILIADDKFACFLFLSISSTKFDIGILRCRAITARASKKIFSIETLVLRFPIVIERLIIDDGSSPSTFFRAVVGLRPDPAYGMSLISPPLWR